MNLPIIITLTAIFSLSGCLEFEREAIDVLRCQTDDNCPEGSRCNGRHCVAVDVEVPRDTETTEVEVTDTASEDVAPHDHCGPVDRCRDDEDCCEDLSTSVNTCVSLNSPEHCGACNNPCSDTEECIGGTCACIAGYASCESGAEAVCGTDLNSSPMHCGGCDQACSDRSGCEGGSCSCGGARCPWDSDCQCCEDPTTLELKPVDRAEFESSVVHCGDCFQRCGTGEVCAEGQCRCGGGEACEGDAICCAGTCVPPSDSTCVCGTASSCLVDQLGDPIDNGACCDDSCVDLGSDAQHCGGCGNACQTPRICDGFCVCPIDECDGSCTDVDSDPRNCGDCGQACPEGVPCNGGLCVCSELSVTEVEGELISPELYRLDTRLSCRFDSESLSLGESLVLHSGQRGRLDESALIMLDDDPASVAFSSTLRAGEQVEISVTSGLTNDTAGALETPYVWRFRAGTEPASSSPLAVQAYAFTNALETRDVDFGDMNGDGLLDIVLTSFQQATGSTLPAIEIYLNQGGTLNTAFNLQTPDFQFPAPTTGEDFDNIVETVLGDMDGDGDLDAIAVQSGDRNRLFINDGQGQMRFEKVWLGAQASAGVELGDLDGDGDLDVVIAQSNVDSAFYINETYWNVSLGAYRYRFQQHDLEQTRLSSAVALGDLDGDGDLDIVLGGAKNNEFPVPTRVLLNRGPGSDTSLSFTQELEVDPCATPRDLDIGDFDGDGDLDLLLPSDLNAPYVSEGAACNAQLVGERYPSRVFLNEGFGRVTGKLVLSPGPEIGTPRSVRSARLHDLDGDGDLDVAISTEFSNTTDVYLNTDGILNEPSAAVVLSNSAQEFLDCADLDGDSDLDCVSVNNNGEASQLLENLSR